MKLLYILLITCFTISFSFAQIEEGNRSMSQGSNNAISLEIPNAEAKFAKKVWTKYIKEETKGGKTKWDKKMKEFFSDDLEYVAIGGANTIDLYAKFTNVGENVEVSVWFDLGGAYLNSEMHGDKYNEGAKFLMRFAIEVAIETTKMELKEEEKKKKNLQNDLESLKKKKEGYHKDIEIAKNKIAEAEANIEQNIKDQENTNGAILEQDNIIEKIRKKLEQLEK